MEREPKKPTMNDAMAHIEMIRGMIYPAGRVDEENYELNSIKERLEKFEITPLQAMRMADGILRQRQEN